MKRGPYLPWRHRAVTQRLRAAWLEAARLANEPIPPARPAGGGGWCQNCGVTHIGPHPAASVQGNPRG